MDSCYFSNSVSKRILSQVWMCVWGYLGVSVLSPLSWSLLLHLATFFFISLFLSLTLYFLIHTRIILHILKHGSGLLVRISAKSLFIFFLFFVSESLAQHLPAIFLLMQMLCANVMKVPVTGYLSPAQEARLAPSLSLSPDLGVPGIWGMSHSIIVFPFSLK